MNMHLVGHHGFSQETSDITGFSQENREFAVVGLLDAAAFIDITNPSNPFETGRIVGNYSIWRDIKYWNQHVYIGTEADDGIKIVDVSNLDNPILVNTITDIDNSHNIHIYEGYLYIIGADTHDIWIYDLSDPVNPEFVGAWDQEYIHDIDVYNNKVYAMGIYTSTVYIINVSDKTNPQTLVSWSYDGMAHDCAITPDEQILVTADEIEGGHLKIWDISDYSNIHEISSFQINSTHSIHNIYYKNGMIIGSWYADGTRALDISDPYNPIEVGFYDTSDIDDVYVGNWGTYVYLPSGRIISSDIETGLYILEFGISINHNPIENIISDGSNISIEAEIQSFSSDIVYTGLYYKNYFANEWTSLEMEPCNFAVNGYCGQIPPQANGIHIEYFIIAENFLEQVSFSPVLGEESPYTFNVGQFPIIFQDDMESSIDWTIGGDDDNATSGIWEWADPNGVYEGNSMTQPGDDHSEFGEYCFLTGNGVSDNAGFDDVDGGLTSLLSPVYTLGNWDEIILDFWYWYSNNLGNNPGTDHFVIEFRENNNLPFQILFDTTISTDGWKRISYYLSSLINDFNQIQFRFSASDYYYVGNDGSGASLVEAAIDDIKFFGLNEIGLPGDTNLDGIVDVLDIVMLVNLILGNVDSSIEMELNADLDSDGLFTVVDVILIVNLIL